MAEANFTCQKCGKQPESRNDLIADHIIPIALGGAEFDKSNLQILCHECNKLKTRQDIKNIAKARKREHLEIHGVDSLVKVSFPLQETIFD